MTAPAASEPRGRSLPWLPALGRPRACYHLIIGTTCLLTAIGLVMVLSTSSASQLYAGQSPYSVFLHQLVGVVIGVPLIWVLSRTSPRVLRALANPLMIAAIASLVLVLFIGQDVNGARRWIELGPVQIQPSEFAKLALLIWGADLLARKEELRQLNDWRGLLMPLLPGAVLLALLVQAEHDLGTTFILLVILLALLWVVGTPGRLFTCMLALIGFALLASILVKGYESARLFGFLHPGGGPTGPNQQAIQGQTALGSGQLFGVGLGHSREKWGWVPNASTDFIFSILGEEFGLIGTLCVVFLYAGLAYAGLRVARRMSDPFLRLAAAGITVWIAGQALVNICTVTILLPITGVPLPLISQGLSSLLVTMAAIGVLLCCARHEPDAAAVAVKRTVKGPVKRPVKARQNNEV
ncbi:MAG TPA: putative lipid II flippase FtsW [Streptosporangiaceae bacterium]|nr:putative lipid II flippase FtsW [Streptosporangiaceae bacterium]